MFASFREQHNGTEEVFIVYFIQRQRGKESDKMSFRMDGQKKKRESLEDNQSHFFWMMTVLAYSSKDEKLH